MKDMDTEQKRRVAWGVELGISLVRKAVDGGVPIEDVLAAAMGGIERAEGATDGVSLESIGLRAGIEAAV